MHSSTSSFEQLAPLQRTSSSGADRLTAADRPGVAQPVPERPVPIKPWGPIFLSVVVAVLVATAVWEWHMRSLELLPGDLRDGPSFWAEQRRRVDTENVAVAIVGDSRILFDTDLDRFEALTGVRPLQLALPGTNARPFLENLAADPDFKGLVLVGMADLSYFRKDVGLMADALERYEFESPAQRSSFVLHRQLSRVLGLLDENYRLSNLVKRLDPGWRAGTQGPYDGVWKLSTAMDDRQTALWLRIESDAYLNGHARNVWLQRTSLPPVDEEIIAMTQQATREAVAAIRARGGEVVFLRPPSKDAYRANENRRLGRERGWDALLAAATVAGIHADDDPVTRDLNLPELSHLSRACSTVYTDAYVRSLAKITSRLQLRSAAPPPLAASDCLAGGTHASLQRAAAPRSASK